MPYGQKNAPKALEQYGLLDKLGLGIASAFGIAAATFIDLTQADDASALFVFNKWLAEATSMLGLGSLPLYAVVLILMGIGGISITYFQPVTFRGAFAQGFAALAVLMNLAPADLGEPLPGSMINSGSETQVIDELPLPSSDGDDEWMEEEISFSTSSTSSLVLPAAMMVQSSDGYSLRMKVRFPEGLKEDVPSMIRKGTLRGRLHNESTGATYNLFRNSGAGVQFRNNTLYLSTRLPGSTPTTRLVARIEADGYCIEEESFEAKKGANPIWEVVMDSGCGPLMLQRLNRSYDF